jgi:ubiquinone/menaquinone biosynthesis C-methylase UbiE
VPSVRKDISSDRIQDALYAFTRSQILFTAIELDVFSQIANGANTLTLLRERLDLSRRGARMLLNGLVGIEFLNVSTDGVYSIPEDAEHYLVRSKADYLGGMVQHGRRLYENWSQLSDSVRSGQPAGGAQSLAQLEAHFAELVKGLYVSNYPSAKRLAEFLASQSNEANTFSPQAVLDVAGGSGVWSIALLEQFLEAQATILDFDSVLPVARDAVSQHKLENRFAFLAGDIEEMDLPSASFDCAIMANICHVVGPVSTRKAFHQLSQVLRPGGRLVIVDFMPDDARSQPGWPMIFGVNMLVTTVEGDVFTAAQYESWLQAAGFSQIIHHELEKDVTALVAIR